MDNAYCSSNDQILFERNAGADLRKKASEELYQRLFNKKRDKGVLDIKEAELKELSDNKARIARETYALKFSVNEAQQLKHSELIALQRKRAELKEKNSQADKERNSLIATRDNTMKLIEEQSKEGARLKQRIENLYSKLAIDNNDQYSLLQERNLFFQTKKESRVEKRRYIEENKKLSYECKLKNDILKTSQRENDRLLKQLEAVKAEVSSIRNDIREKTEEIGTINDVNTKLQLKLIEIEGELNCLGIESDNMKEQLVKERSGSSVEETRKNQMETRLLDKDKEINVLICQLDHESKYEKIVEEDMKRFQSDKKRMTEYISRLEREIASLSREKEELTDKSYVEEQKSLRLTDLHTGNRSFMNETMKTFVSPEVRPEAYEITVHNLNKGE